MNIRVVLMLVHVIGMLVGCGPTRQTVLSKTTDTSSTTLGTDAEKIAFLERYLKLPSAIQATEFHIVYHDNSGGLVGGPSDWDIQAVMRVAPADIGRWTDGMQPVEASSVDLAWVDALLRLQSGWLLGSPPVVYERSGAMVAVYEADGIVAKRVWTAQ